MEIHPNIILFGEAERGDFFHCHHCRSLTQLLETFGQPPPMSRGIHFAVQALLYECELIFFRVKEEGYSYQDYFRGLKLLSSNSISTFAASALCAPGVGDLAILDAMRPICSKYHSILITNEADLYDFLMASRESIS